MSERPVCRCGVYEHLHPITNCEKPRHSYWWHRHMLHRHAFNWLWIHATSRRLRYRVIYWMSGEKRCFCDLFDSAYYADEWSDRRNDYRKPWGCLCDFPMIWDARPPTGDCYCSTRATEATR